MLNGKRYFAEFPDEDPAAAEHKLLRSPTLMAALKALEKELRRYLHREPKPGLRRRDVHQNSR